MKKCKTKQLIVKERLQEICKEYMTTNGYGYMGFKKHFNISPSSFTRVMYFNGDFSLTTMYKIAKELNISMDWLCGLTDNKYINNKKEI